MFENIFDHPNTEIPAFFEKLISYKFSNKEQLSELKRLIKVEYFESLRRQFDKDKCFNSHLAI